MRENDFSQPVKQMLAERAGFRCSVPGCNQITVGPGANETESARIGMACHIFSAEKNGPRGNGGLNSEQLKSLGNGFWACFTHGKLIDTNDGKKFPAPLLIHWRRLHAARIEREMSGKGTSLGWVESLEVVESFLFRPSSTFTLSKSTLIVSSEANGKTAICEWIDGLFRRNILERWRHHDHDVRLTYFTPEEQHLRLEIRNGEITRHWNGQRLVGAPKDVSLVHVPDDVYRKFPTREFHDDLEWFAAVFDAEKEDIKHICEEVRIGGYALCRSMEFCVENFEGAGGEPSGETGESLYVGVDRPAHKTTFRGLATSEGYLVLAQMAAALARIRSRQTPTLLLLDAAGWNWGEEMFKSVAEYLANEPYQVVCTYGYRILDLADPAWRNWVALDLRGYADRH